MTWVCLRGRKLMRLQILHCKSPQGCPWCRQTVSLHAVKFYTALWGQGHSMMKNDLLSIILLWQYIFPLETQSPLAGLFFSNGTLVSSFCTIFILTNNRNSISLRLQLYPSPFLELKSPATFELEGLIGSIYQVIYPHKMVPGDTRNDRQRIMRL